MKIQLSTGTRDAYVEYKKKKNISLTIDPEGFITIRAPLGIPEEELEKIIAPMAPKIEKRLAEIEKNKQIFNEGSYNDDEYFKLFGEYVSYVESGIAQSELPKYYLDSLKDYLDESLNRYSKLMGVKFKEVKITQTKTTWGTCNTSKKLTFNLRLAMAPKSVIDYVVVHELAHLKHMNHDRSFWNTVGKVLPDYKEIQGYLKKFGQFMTL